MNVSEITPILNVSDLDQSYEWFRKLGWEKAWEWCPPGTTQPTFGAVASGGNEIFLCLDGQGGRGDQGVWISVWVDDVDEVYARCRAESVEVISPPEDKPWRVRELHVRHPEGHILRIGTNISTLEHR